jgi:hypothetical protein
VLEGGIGLVALPMRRPDEVKAELDAGSVEAGLYWISATWVGANGAESAPSAMVAVEASDPHSLRVWTMRPPLGATGWNVYIGASQTSMQMQNVAPIAVGTEWHQQAALTESGVEPPSGQEPEFYCSRQRLLRRS